MRVEKYIKPVIMIALIFIFIMYMAMPLSVSAEESEQKPVRVGWYESSFCTLDKYGRRSGIAYEYQQVVAAHTGWEYEYVEDSWPNLLKMLVDGEIDLLSDVSYTEERAKDIYYSDLPMGSEAYYIYIDADNREITSENLESFNGKKIGANAGSVQAGFLRDWAAKNGLTPEIIEMTNEEPEAMTMLANGEIDAYVSMNSFGAVDRCIPVCRIGASEYFFAVNKDRPDLLQELNGAMNAIQEENPYFNSNMVDEYVHLTGTNAFLDASLEEWLEKHGPIRVGYCDNLLPFCAQDKTSGEVTGALKDFLAHASNCLKNAEVRFETVPFSSTDEAVEAMKNGEVDCVFPQNISTYDGEIEGLMTVGPIMHTEMNVLRREEDRPQIIPGENLTVAIDEGNKNYETFIMDSMPEWTIKNYPTVEECYRAVDSKEADCVLTDDYRMNEYEELKIKYNLVSLPTGEVMGLSLAEEKGDRELYSILNKIVALTAPENMEYALVSYMYSNQKVSFLQFMEDNWLIVVIFIVVIFIVIVILLLQKLKAERRANEQQRLLEEAEEIRELEQTITSLLNNIPGLTFTKDAQTGVYLVCNQAFAQYAHKATPEEVSGLTDAQIFDAETAAHFVEDDRMAISMNKPYIFYEDVPDAAGNPRQFQTTKMKYTDTSGRQCVLGICLDLTDMVRIPRQNASTKEAYENARNVGIMYTHIAQTLARDYTDMYYVNLDSEEYIEYRRSEKDSALSETRRGWHFFSDCKMELAKSVYPDDQKAFLDAMERRTLMKALTRKNTFMMTFRLLGENGPYYVNMKVSQMENDDRFIIAGITNVDAEIRDTMSKSEALADALAAAEEANKAKAAFLSSMSHEIRTPMNAIIGLDTLALRDENLPEQTRDYLEKIGGSARHLLNIINDILDISRIESGRLGLKKEVFSFDTMLEQINSRVGAECAAKGLEYSCSVLNQVEASYYGDDKKLKQVLSNILSNAVKFTDAPGSVALTVEQTAKFENMATLRFRIKDTGIGMEQDFLPKAFDAFSQEDIGRKTRYGSSGLGLAITKSIVETMNGSISVESEKGVGTEFTVTVSLRTCDQGDSDFDRPIDPAAMYVLVVDDDRIAAEHAQTVLQEVGIRTDICTSGEEALRMMEEQHAKHDPYNLVLMDWQMPGMNGLEASAEIQKQYSRETTVVVLTAYSWDDIQEDAQRVGVDSFIGKPLFAANVIEEFERIVRKNKMPLFREKERADLTGRRILLAEDMELNAEIMMDLLKLEGIEADHAINGKAAVEMFGKSAVGTYAAILMDVRMPEMDGLEATEIIRALDRDDAKRIPIIALTANAFDEDVQLSLQAGMNAHLTKPVESDYLLRTLGELVYEAEKDKN